MALIKTLGLDMPPDFPVDAYNAVADKMSSTRVNPIPRQEWQGAWNAIAHRFMACATHDDAFTESVGYAGRTPLAQDRHVQERELYNFFVNGLSAIDSVCYAMFAFASMIKPAVFPMTTFRDRQNVTPRETRDRYDRHFAGDAMTTLLDSVLDSAEFKKWSSIRNVLAHRITPGRITNMPEDQTTMKVQLATGIEDLPIDMNTTVSRRPWLARTLKDLLTGAAAFVKRLP